MSDIDLDIRDEVQVTLYGRVSEDRAFHPSDAKSWDRAMGELAGHEVRLLVSRYKLRTPAANAYLWGAVYPFLLDGLRQLALNAGETCPFADRDALHFAMKHRFREALGTGSTLFLGDVYEDEPTTRVSGFRFHRYIELMSAWAAGLGIYLPQPGEYGLTVPSGQDGEGE